jgi:hypothetical protein
MTKLKARSASLFSHQPGTSHHLWAEKWHYIKVYSQFLSICHTRHCLQQIPTISEECKCLEYARNEDHQYNARRLRGRSSDSRFNSVWYNTSTISIHLELISEGQPNSLPEFREECKIPRKIRHAMRKNQCYPKVARTSRTLVSSFLGIAARAEMCDLKICGLKHFTRANSLHHRV